MKKILHTILEVHFFYVILIAFVVAMSSLYMTFAAEYPRLVDKAELLSDSEKTELLYILDEISERQQVDIIVLTVPSLEGASPVE